MTDLFTLQVGVLNISCTLAERGGGTNSQPRRSRFVLVMQLATVGSVGGFSSLE